MKTECVNAKNASTVKKRICARLYDDDDDAVAVVVVCRHSRH